jgi:hypothetical protein
MKTTFISLAFVLGTISVFAQNQIKQTGSVVKTEVAIQTYQDFEGTPYIPVVPEEGTFKIVGGNKVFTFPMRYDSFVGKVEYLEGDIWKTPSSSVSEFSIGKLNFRKNNIDVQNGYYQLMYDGKSKIVKTFKTILKSDNASSYASSISTKSFDTAEIYYLIKPSGESSKISKPSQKVLLKLLSDKPTQIEEYLAREKLKIDNWDDFEKVISYYDTL